jgi:hypothetical protein
VKIVYSNHAGANVRRLAAQLGASYFFDKTLDTPSFGRCWKTVRRQAS